MIDGRNSTARLNLTRDPDQPPLMVDMEAFFEFSFWLAEELEDLVARHRMPISDRPCPWMNLPKVKH